MTSNPTDLTARLRRRLETEHQQIEETAASELRQLGESLSAVASDALRTVEADTAAATGRLRALLLRAGLWPMVIGLSLFLGICGGSWAAMPPVGDDHRTPDRDLGGSQRGHRAGPRDAGPAQGDDVGREVARDRRRRQGALSSTPFRHRTFPGPEHAKLRDVPDAEQLGTGTAGWTDFSRRAKL